MAQLTRVPFYILAPVLIALIFFATFNASRDWIDFFSLMVFGAIGVVFKAFGWSRPALLIGFFLASKIELLSYQANAAYGWSFLTRSGSLLLVALALATIVFLIRQKGSKVAESSRSDQKGQLIFTGVLALFPAAMILAIIELDPRANVFPIALSGALLITLFMIAGLQAMRLNPTTSKTVSRFTPLRIMSQNIFENEGTLSGHLRNYMILPVFFGLVMLLGFPIAAVALINGFVLMHDRRKYIVSGAISAAVLIILWTLSGALTLQYPAGVIANVISLPWWLGGAY
jgi:hypothetical protein